MYMYVITPVQVEDAWKDTEFIVLSHRDSKDVFILGGTDDIQVLLDDSQVHIHLHPELGMLIQYNIINAYKYTR